MAAVLVVEDNPEHQAVLAEIVRRLGHQVTVAGDGREGLAVALDTRPDLVIADVDMPHLDGIRMCRALRADPVTADVPVVLITGYLPPGDSLLDDTQAAAVVSKPFSVRGLTETLRTVLESAVPGRDDGAFLTGLMQSLDVGVVACDLAGRIVLVNQAVRDFYGEESVDVPLRDWPERFRLKRHDGTPIEPGELPLDRARRGEEVHHADLLAYDRLHRPRWFAVNARPVRDRTGLAIGALAAVHDVTADHHQHQYENCKTEVLKVLVHAWDTARAGEAVLRAISECLGWPHLRLWLVDEMTERLRPAATHTVTGAGAGSGEELAELCWERGELVWVPDAQGGAVPVRSAEKVVGVITFFCADPLETDPALAVLLTGIAGLFGAYLERRRSEELANQLAASIGEYIALVGHELRTPLTSIATYTDLIAESGDETTIGEVRDLLDVIERNNARLRHLVERLLDLAALESGHADLTIGTVDLSAAVQAAVATVTAEAGEPRPQVRTDLPDRLTIPGDQARLRQVAENLIGNAVKYSPAGSTVTVSLTADEDAAVLTVADTGMGIPDNERNRLFARLYRATNARHSGIPGAGLGLALSRAIIELHRGTITLGGGDEGGTIATVRLPRSAP
ncbi:ATP-binding protein [Actinoplanes sp. NPDC051851]|uniref:ATP-binding protein n=1 Tax=Actinoplanes sp. NPDC051851 TaxID=3154753 RepID=UPI00342DFCE6